MHHHRTDCTVATCHGAELSQLRTDATTIWSTVSKERPMLGNKRKQVRIDLVRGFLLNCSTCYIYCSHHSTQCINKLVKGSLGNDLWVNKSVQSQYATESNCEFHALQ